MSKRMKGNDITCMQRQSAPSPWSLPLLCCCLFFAVITPSCDGLAGKWKLGNRRIHGCECLSILTTGRAPAPPTWVLRTPTSPPSTTALCANPLLVVTSPVTGPSAGPCSDPSSGRVHNRQQDEKMWPPYQAAEFVFNHHGAPKEAGDYLFQFIQHWTGKDLGEFLARLYLGEKKAVSDRSVSYESKNVRKPRWVGSLDAEKQGLSALLELLLHAIPSKIVIHPQEIMRCAEYFLLQEYTWPSSIDKFDRDSFADRGYSDGIATVLASIRKTRHELHTASTWSSVATSSAFTPYDVLAMLHLPEFDSVKAQATALKLLDFYAQLDFRWTKEEEASFKRGAALRGWEPWTIEKFMNHINVEILEDQVRDTASGTPVGSLDANTNDLSGKVDCERKSPLIRDGSFVRHWRRHKSLIMFGKSRHSVVMKLLFPGSASPPPHPLLDTSYMECKSCLLSEPTLTHSPITDETISPPDLVDVPEILAVPVVAALPKEHHHSHRASLTYA